MKKNEIGKNVCWIEIDGSHYPNRVPILDRTDLRKYTRYRIEDKHTYGIAQNCNKVKDHTPRMADLHSFLLAIIHAPETIFTVVFPVGAWIFLPPHDDRTVRAGFCTEPASDTTVIGKHHLAHKKSTDQEISRNKEREIYKQKHSPEIFPEVVQSEPYGLSGKQLWKISICFSFCTGFDEVDVFIAKPAVDRDHVRRHVKAQRAADVVSFEG